MHMRCLSLESALCTASPCFNSSGSFMSIHTQRVCSPCRHASMIGAFQILHRASPSSTSIFSFHRARPAVEAGGGLHQQISSAVHRQPPPPGKRQAAGQLDERGGQAERSTSRHTGSYCDSPHPVPTGQGQHPRHWHWRESCERASEHASCLRGRHGRLTPPPTSLHARSSTLTRGHKPPREVINPHAKSVASTRGHKPPRKVSSALGCTWQWRQVARSRFGMAPIRNGPCGVALSWLRWTWPFPLRASRTLAWAGQWTAAGRSRRSRPSHAGARAAALQTAGARTGRERGNRRRDSPRAR
jgi:hypothetical protein